MTEIWTQAALWLGLALIATLLSIWLRIATSLSEIVVGTVAQLAIGAFLGGAISMGADASWIKFLSGAGATVLTFLAGAELDPAVFRRKWKVAVEALMAADILVPTISAALGLLFTSFAFASHIEVINAAESLEAKTEGSFGSFE